MKEIKVALPKEDIDLLDTIAKENNSSRASVIRDNLKSNGISSATLESITKKILCRMNGAYTRVQAEHCAAIAICEFAKNQENN